MKILIIEDEEAIRQLLQEMLEMNGHTVLAGADGPEGIALAEQGPELILCDVNMPGMDGYAVIEHIRKMPGCGAVPFIFLTALADRSAQRRGMALGADDFITKPFSIKEILDAIAARVGRQKTLQERVEGLIEHHRREASADWSHELMTPLHGVLGGLELIESEGGTLKPAELKDLLGLIREGAERQRRLSLKLVRHFELERVRGGSRPGGVFRCQVRPSVDGGVARAATEEKRAADVAVECGAGEVALPPGYLTDAVAELVSNACRFSRSGQPVSVRGRKEGTDYVLDVTDEGAGMTAEECAKVGAFVKFKHASFQNEGLGLGIAIARAVAEIGGGRLKLGTGAGGRGLRATLVIPAVS